MVAVHPCQLYHYCMQQVLGALGNQPMDSLLHAHRNKSNSAPWQELEDRNKFLEALAIKYTVGGLPEAGPLPELAPLPEDEAIILIQANERGRQARKRAQAMRTFKRQRQLEDRRARSGVVRSSQGIPAAATIFLLVCTVIRVEWTTHGLCSM